MASWWGEAHVPWASYRIESVPPGCKPLLVFLNTRSGPQAGSRLRRQLLRLLNPIQVPLLTKSCSTSESEWQWQRVANTLAFEHFNCTRVIEGAELFTGRSGQKCSKFCLALVKTGSSFLALTSLHAACRWLSCRRRHPKLPCSCSQMYQTCRFW